MIYPKELEELLGYFKKLPGVGEKSAERMTFSLLEFSKDDIFMFSKCMIDAKNNLKTCSECGYITSSNKCFICDNEYRNHNLICVVEDYKSVIAFEKMGKYQGVYHVLGGLISPIDGVGPEDINISKLIERCTGCESPEVVVALKPSIEGETTTRYLNKILEKNNVNISRLSYGLPVGTELDYLDSLTLERAFEDRKKIS